MRSIHSCLLLRSLLESSFCNVYVCSKSSPPKAKLSRTMFAILVLPPGKRPPTVSCFFSSRPLFENATLALHGQNTQSTGAYNDEYFATRGPLKSRPEVPRSFSCPLSSYPFCLVPATVRSFSREKTSASIVWVEAGAESRCRRLPASSLCSLFSRRV
jgi:hypothetical protein